MTLGKTRIRLRASFSASVQPVVASERSPVNVNLAVGGFAGLLASVKPGFGTTGTALGGRIRRVLGEGGTTSAGMGTFDVLATGPACICL